MNKEIIRTLMVALIVSIICSILVSVTSVVLKDKQIANANAAIETTIVKVSGLTDASIENFTPVLVNFNNGCISSQSPENYNQKKALLSSDLSSSVARKQDIAKINRREHLAKIWYVGDISEPEVIVLPVRGYGLWGTMYAFLALDGDLKTIRGIEVYEHKETPGLGGEVENPKWKNQWDGKVLYDDDWQVVLTVIKGQVQPNKPNSESLISGLAGATLTTNGINNLIKYWFQEQNYGGILQCIQSLKSSTANAQCNNLLPSNCQTSNLSDITSLINH